MKCTLLSDLHFEFANSNFNTKLPNADYLLLAGDLCNSNKNNKRLNSFLHHAYDTYGKDNVLRIDGNHEAYRGTITDYTNKQIYIEDSGIAIIGATLWSGKHSKQAYDLFLNDALSVFRFTWQWMYSRHLSDLAFIVSKLHEANKKGLKTIVMTHHMPSWECVDDCYKNQGPHGTNAGFYTDLNHIIKEFKPDVWVCGHTHSSFDKKVFDTRLICNPRGYPSHHGTFENSDFDPYKTFKI